MLGGFKLARLKYEQLEALKEKYNVDRIWSYSRLSTYLERPFEYRLTYLEKAPRGSNIYSYFGTICHDIIQDFYDDKYPYEDMVKIYERACVKWKKEGEYKFMSENVERSYIKNLHDYFKNTEVLPYELENETPILIKMHDKKRDKNVVFIGYADSIYTDENDITYILDYKTSSKSGFTGAKLKSEKSLQLRLYAEGLHQMRGIPYEKIRCRFDMQKYYEVWYHSVTAKGVEKITKSKQERFKWVSGMTNKLSKDLANLGYDPFEVDEMVEVSVEQNNLLNLPQEVQDKYELHNCYIDVEVSEEDSNEMMDMIVEVVNEIQEKEKLDWEVEFPEPPILGSSEQFYWETLASHLLPYAKNYQKNLAMVKGRTEDIEDDDLLALFED